MTLLRRRSEKVWRLTERLAFSLALPSLIACLYAEVTTSALKRPLSMLERKVSSAAKARVVSASGYPEHFFSRVHPVAPTNAGQGAVLRDKLPTWSRGAALALDRGASVVSDPCRLAERAPLEDILSGVASEAQEVSVFHSGAVRSFVFAGI